MFLFARSLTRRRGGAEFTKYVRHLCVLFLFANFLFFGCGGNDHRMVSLDGTWVSAYSEYFIINLNANPNTFKSTMPSYTDYDYWGNISEIVRFGNGSAGIIYVNVTGHGTNWSSSGTGTFTGVHFKYLNNTTVEFSTAMDNTYATPVYNTLALAKQALNENTLGTYFGTGSACTKN